VGVGQERPARDGQPLLHAGCRRRKQGRRAEQQHGRHLPGNHELALGARFVQPALGRRFGLLGVVVLLGQP
jgi:hypothetical protein